MRSDCMAWLYALAALPTLTNLLETGAPPSSWRSWMIEIALGVFIAVLVYRVRRDYRELTALAGTDPLTGLRNRRVFMKSLRDECERASRTQQPLTLVYIDLDNLKQINDRAGHDEGDRVLRQLSAAIHSELHAHTDEGFRLGGDEFALLMPGGCARHAERVLTSLRTRCAAIDAAWAAGLLGISSGAVEYTASESAEDFLRRGDEAMYQMKMARKATRQNVAWQPAWEAIGYSPAHSFELVGSGH